MSIFHSIKTQMKQKKFYLKTKKTPQKGDLKNEFIEYTCPVKLFNNFDKLCSEEIKSKSLIVRTILREFEDLMSDREKTMDYLIDLKKYKGDNHIRQHIRIDGNLKKHILKLSDETGYSVSVIIQICLVAYLKERRW